jgi:RHS repeat-associated protein
MSCANGTTYAYDGDGLRVKKSSGTLYWAGGVAESDSSGNITSEYVFFAGARIARRDVATGNVYYYLSDHLGSSNVVTNATGVIQNESDFYPFGGERQITNNLANQHFKFTGKERDAESGLDEYDFRNLNTSMGRWMRPDPSGIMFANPMSPQSMNLYSYVVNNPLSMIDPNGLETVPDGSEGPLWPILRCIGSFFAGTGCGGGWGGGNACIGICAGSSFNEFIFQSERNHQSGSGQSQNAASGSGSGDQPFSANLGSGYSVSGTFGEYDSTRCSYCIAGKGATIDAHSNCSMCEWVQVYDRTGADAAIGGLDNSALSGTPFYPNSDHGSFWDQPKNWMRGDWSKGGGTFSAVSVLGIPDLANHTFHPVGAVSWGYSVSASGKLTLSRPTSTPGRISEAMMFMHQAMPAWSEN